MAIASGIIIPWPSTAASIPSGWSRETALDAVFLKGVPTAATNPGTTGGAATHSHTTGGTHTHTTTHSHPMSGNTGAGSGSSLAGLGASGASATHTHTNPAAVASATPGASGTAQPNSDTQSNDPINLAVIWIKSDGSPTGLPNSGLAFFNSDTLPGSWTRYANGQNRYLKGAAAAGDGGGTNAGNSSHTHATAAHSHTVSSHTHAASGTTGTPSSSGASTGGTARAGSTHTHTVSADAATATTGTTVQSETVSGSGSSEPTYFKLNIIQNGTGGISWPDKIICAWTGTIATIPTSWVICDGNNTTPNTLGKYIKGSNADGELGNTGGSNTHTHTDPGTHTHPEGTDVHATTVSAESASTNMSTTAVTTTATTTHTHTGANTGTSTDSTGTGTAGTYNTPNSEPPYYEVAFLQWQGGDVATSTVQDIIGGLGIIPFAR